MVLYIVAQSEVRRWILAATVSELGRTLTQQGCCWEGRSAERQGSESTAQGRLPWALRPAVHPELAGSFELVSLFAWSTAEQPCTRACRVVVQ